MVSNHVMDLIERYGFDSEIPAALTDYVKARKFYDYKDHSRVGAKHGEFVTDEICDRFCVLGTPEQATEKLKELESIGVDQFDVYLMTEGQERDARGLRQGDHPPVRRRRRLERQLEKRKALDETCPRARAAEDLGSTPASSRQPAGVDSGGGVVPRASPPLRAGAPASASSCLERERRPRAPESG